MNPDKVAQRTEDTRVNPDKVAQRTEDKQCESR